MNTVALLLSLAMLCSSLAAFRLESDYRKYLRTRPPRDPSEVHVEEVLEVFKSRNRPPAYGVYNAYVNGFLANERFMKNKSTTSTTTSTTVRPRVWLTIATVDTRSTYPTPTGDNVNPDYTNPFSPSVPTTKYPASVPPTTIIIQEGRQKTKQRQPQQPSEFVTEKPVPNLEEDDAYQYSDEDDFEQ